MFMELNLEPKEQAFGEHLAAWDSGGSQELSLPFGSMIQKLEYNTDDIRYRYEI